MGLVYLLDTNIISEPAKPNPDPTVLAKIRQHQESIAISSITWHELLFGYDRLPESKKKERIKGYLNFAVRGKIAVLEYGQDSAEIHANERAKLVSSGLTPSFADGQIAAIAQSNNLILVTRNTQDFKNFSEISIENWFEKI